MLAVAILDSALLALALLFIVALLRSHADILRRLAVLEDGGAGAPAPSAVRPQDVRLAAAADIAGVTLAGDSVKLSLGPGSPRTLLAFLSSGCAACGPLWDGMRDAGHLSELAERVVIVAHDASRESTARLRTLAPADVELILAGAAWQDYAVPASPHFVLTDGAGAVAGRGSALSWPQLVSMVHTARDDAQDMATMATRSTGERAARSTGERAARSTGERAAQSTGERAAQSTGERAARAGRALARAGIGPGHPSLYPDAAVLYSDEAGADPGEAGPSTSDAGHSGATEA
jgi:hypothetical protein